MDLRWQMAMLTKRLEGFLLSMAMGPLEKNKNQDKRNRESLRRSVLVKTTTSNALISCDGLGGYYWSDHAEEGPTNYALMAYSSSSSDSEVYREITIGELRKKLEIVQKEKDGIQFNVDKFENASKSLNKIIESQIVDNCKKEEFINEPVVIKHVVENSEAKASEVKPKVVRKNNGAPIIEDWVSDSEE
ncbi:hypothetical protein Tco_0866229 [Tanacetum coccineum]